MIASKNVGMFTVSAYHKGMMNTSALKPRRLLAISTKSLKSIFLALAVFCVTFSDLKAEFTSLPIMQEFAHVISDDDAVSQLFNTHNYEFAKLETKSSQAKSLYAVVASKHKFFVKIIREDCHFCNETLFNYEWQLKEDKQKNDLMKTVGAELILPNNSATFILENKKHLIVAYPWAPGRTLDDIYIDHFSVEKNSETLKMAMYRYGQVIAISDLDQNDPSDDVETLLNRKSQILLEDRHGGNTKYFERNNKIYLLDLALVPNDKDYGYTVRESIEAAYMCIDHLFNDFLEYDMRNFTYSDIEYIYGYGREYLSIPVSQFILGYISALPKYDPNVVKEILLEQIYDDVDFHCGENFGVYCDLFEVLKLIK